MPTLSARNQMKRNRQAYTALRDFDGPITKLARKLDMNHYYLYAVKNGEDCTPKLWQALLKAKLVQPIPREQKSFLVPVDNYELAVMKFQEHYPDAVVMREWVAT